MCVSCDIMWWSHDALCSQATEDQACLRKFLSLHGLRLLWSWMADSPEPDSVDVLHFREQVSLPPLTSPCQRYKYAWRHAQNYSKELYVHVHVYMYMYTGVYANIMHKYRMYIVHVCAVKKTAWYCMFWCFNILSREMLPQHTGTCTCT